MQPSRSLPPPPPPPRLPYRHLCKMVSDHTQRWACLYASLSMGSCLRETSSAVILSLSTINPAIAQKHFSQSRLTRLKLMVIEKTIRDHCQPIRPQPLFPKNGSYKRKTWFCYMIYSVRWFRSSILESAKHCVISGNGSPSLNIQSLSSSPHSLHISFSKHITKILTFFW